VLGVNGLATLVNVVLDFVFIFGMLGFPAWGIFGAGLATTLSIFLKAICYGALIYRKGEWQTYGWNSIERMIEGPLMGRFLLFSTPAGLQHLLESGTFLVIVLKIGQLEPAALAATTMAINFNMVAFVPLIGVSIAASVLVGHHLTRAGPTLAARATRSALVVSMSYAMVSAIVYLVAPHWLLSLYFSSSLTAATKQIAVQETVVVLLRFVAAYCMIDAVQLTLAGALRGAGDTWYVLLSSLACTATVIGCGWLLEPLGSANLLYWWWTWMSTWVFLLGIVFGVRVWRGRWLECRLVKNPIPQSPLP
jgi:MATE family multidrug resistance protein